MALFSSPSRGSYISTAINAYKQGKANAVLVPFSGFLYLYIDMEKLKNGKELTFSSPSRGSYISTNKFRTLKCFGKCSRPLLGVLISLLFGKDGHRQRAFSSPSRGSYISTLSSQSLELYTHISAFAAQM